MPLFMLQKNKTLPKQSSSLSLLLLSNFITSLLVPPDKAINSQRATSTDVREYNKKLKRRG